MKFNNLIPQSLLFGLFAGVIFSIIDSALFLYSEKELVHYTADNLPTLDHDEILILLSAISAAISVFIANYIEHHISTRFELMKHPFLDAIGIIIGVFIVIGIYELFYKTNIRDYNDTKDKEEN